MPVLTKSERQIVKRLDTLRDTKVASSNSDREWTVAVKRAVGALGLELGFKVCASDPKGRFEPEWLYDLVWYTGDAHDCLSDVPLILEMEWAMNLAEVRYDFEKLMVGRADLRVMVFQASNPSAVDRYCRLLIQDVVAFKHSAKSDRYLFAGYDQKNGVFVYRAFEL